MENDKGDNLSAAIIIPFCWVSRHLQHYIPILTQFNRKFSMSHRTWSAEVCSLRIRPAARLQPAHYYRIRIQPERPCYIAASRLAATRRIATPLGFHVHDSPLALWSRRLNAVWQRGTHVTAATRQQASLTCRERGRGQQLSSTSIHWNLDSPNPTLI